MERVYNHNDSRQIAQVVNEIASQFDGNTGTITLANSATSTTVTNAKCRSTSRVFLQPKNANSVSTGAYISSISNGSFVITHSNATTTRIFDYVIFDI